MQQDDAYSPNPDTNVRIDLIARFPFKYLASYQAIEAAEQDDIGPLTQLHQALSCPYDEQPEYESLAAAPPAWGKALEVSCSS